MMKRKRDEQKERPGIAHLVKNCLYNPKEKMVIIKGKIKFIRTNTVIFFRVGEISSKFNNTNKISVFFF